MDAVTERGERMGVSLKTWQHENLGTAGILRSRSSYSLQTCRICPTPTTTTPHSIYKRCCLDGRLPGYILHCGYWTNELWVERMLRHTQRSANRWSRDWRPDCAAEPTWSMLVLESFDFWFQNFLCVTGFMLIKIHKVNHNLNWPYP